MMNLKNRLTRIAKLVLPSFLLIVLSSCSDVSSLTTEFPDDQKINVTVEVGFDSAPDAFPTCVNLTNPGNTCTISNGDKVWTETSEDRTYTMTVTGLNNFEKYKFSMGAGDKLQEGTGTPAPKVANTGVSSFTCIQGNLNSETSRPLNKYRVVLNTVPGANIQYGIFYSFYTLLGIEDQFFGSNPFTQSNIIEFEYRPITSQIIIYAGAHNGVHSSEVTDSGYLNLPSCPASGPSAFSLTSAVAASGQVTLNWAASTNATNYTVKYGTSSVSLNQTTTSITNSKVITGLTNGTTYYFEVTATNSIGSINSSNQLSATPTAGAAPGAFTLSSITAGNTQATLAWGVASGTTTYDVKYGTVSGTYTTTLSNRTSPATITSLTNGTTYFFRVTANNAGGSTDSTNQLSVTPAAPTFKKIYVTDLSYSADLTSGGMANANVTADGFCAADTAKPSGGGTYKAMIATATRTACTTANCSGGASENLDWVLAANTEYRRADGTTVIGTTNAAGIFDFVSPLTNSFDTSNTTTMTGFEINWTSSADNCTDWSTTASGNYAVGNATSTTSASINKGSTESCANAQPLVCVEQ